MECYPVVNVIHDVLLFFRYMSRLTSGRNATRALTFQIDPSDNHVL
jgi:hypothetical protein